MPSSNTRCSCAEKRSRTRGTESRCSKCLEDNVASHPVTMVTCLLCWQTYVAKACPSPVCNAFRWCYNKILSFETARSHDSGNRQEVMFKSA